MKQLFFLIAAAVWTLCATAQSHIEAEIDALKSEGAITIQRCNFSNEGDRRVGLLEIYRLRSGDKAATAVNRLLDAFDKDRDGAYNYVRHIAGDDRQSYSIFFDKTDYEVIGKNKHDNYVLLSVLDKDHDANGYRYCYVMEWQGAGADIKGRVIKTYAPKPTASRSNIQLPTPDFSLGDLASLADDTTTVRTMLIGLDSLRNLKGLLMNLKGLKGLSALRIPGDDSIDDPRDDVEWLTAFNHYRNAFKRAASRGSSSATSYATAILKLCKTAQDAQLSDGERSLCRKSIKDLQKCTDDDFLKGLLNEAINHLK